MTPQDDGLTAPRMLRSLIYIMLPPVCLIVLDIYSCIVDLVYICTETPPLHRTVLGIVNSLQWLRGGSEAANSLPNGNRFEAACEGS